MTNQEAIKMLTAKVECIRREASGIDVDCNFRNCDSCEFCYAQGTTGEQRKALNMAISALQAQDSKTRRICDTCNHNHPSKKWPCKWPCVDCDMREPADRWEPQEAKHSTESSLTQKGLDTISRQAAIDAIVAWAKDHNEMPDGDDCIMIIGDLPSAQPEWNNHTVACMLAELFDDTCACNYNGIDEWLPSKCELLDSCPNPAGVACWEQFLKHRAERRTDD